ncbi:ABC-type antimicrobial peptide transport system, permease component [Desulfosporosinus acidiphilus SJ4]|uniref:ABC-type antimicrobial peptide transport system, permease component n=1 Tax=Desulfosporosinus acidiphilus (strain DSM 22704 / JCM 16185 / SJ4) TaxID=646529 RepID=I4DBQ0_DESAJ|nr:ABC transporter permease [Desulfosporosinus acidiphilus]AFM43224.1 ABC-type antimicrobial peptide transport system, permease component [Desulfosporosinus acidiphilus SJ4]
MNFLESIRVSLRALRANKLRSALTMLGMIIGVAAVIAMVGIGNGATASITSQIQGLGSNLLTISSGQSNAGGVRGGFGSSDTLKMTDVSKIQTGALVKAVAPVAQTNAQVVFGSGNTSTTIMGTNQDYQEIKNVTMATGRFITSDDVDKGARVAVLGPTVVTDLFGDANASVIGKVIKINNVPFQVIGVTTATGSTGFMSSDDMITAPISTIQERLLGKKTVRNILVSATSADQMQAAQDQITAELEKAHKIQAGQADDFSIQNQADMLQTMTGVTQTLTMLLGGIAGISLLVGGIGIMNIMLVSVTERTREIGIRKAIGAKGLDIMMQFLIEAVVLSILGGGIGIVLGFGGSTLAGKALKMSTSISPMSVLVAFGFSAAIGIIFGVFPARKAAAMDPIDALRYE